jgi:hypothetical protein
MKSSLVERRAAPLIRIAATPPRGITTDSAREIEAAWNRHQIRVSKSRSQTL